MKDLDTKIIEQGVAKRSGKQVAVKAAVISKGGGLGLMFCFNEGIFMMEGKEMANNSKAYAHIERSIIASLELDAAGSPELSEGVWII